MGQGKAFFRKVVEWKPFALKNVSQSRFLSPVVRLFRIFLHCCLKIKLWEKMNYKHFFQIVSLTVSRRRLNYSRICTFTSTTVVIFCLSFFPDILLLHSWTHFRALKFCTQPILTNFAAVTLSRSCTPMPNVAYHCIFFIISWVLQSRAVSIFYWRFIWPSIFLLVQLIKLIPSHLLSACVAKWVNRWKRGVNVKSTVTVHALVRHNRVVSPFLLFATLPYSILLRPVAQLYGQVRTDWN